MPDNSALQKHWWHRFIKVTTAIFVTIIYAIIVFNVFSFPYYDIIAYFKAPTHVYQVTDTSNNSIHYIGSEDLVKAAKDKYPQYFEGMNDNQVVDAVVKSKLNPSVGETIIQTTISSNFAYKNGASPVSKSRIMSNLVSKTSSMLIVVLILIPSLFYRVLLYIILNNSWKKNKGVSF